MAQILDPSGSQNSSAGTSASSLGGARFFQGQLGGHFGGPPGARASMTKLAILDCRLELQLLVLNLLVVTAGFPMVERCHPVS